MGCLVANGEKMCSSFCSALRMFSTSPGKSCNDIYQINKATRGVSGLYWVETGSRTVQHVYCDMELECGGHKGGWMRVAQLDTTNGDTCPGEWINNANYDSLCTETGGVGCYSANFSILYSYNKICRKVKKIPERKSGWLLPILFLTRFCPICSLYFTFALYYCKWCVC